MSRVKTRSRCYLLGEGEESEGEEGGQGEEEDILARGEGDLQGLADYLKISSFNIFCYLENLILQLIHFILSHSLTTEQDASKHVARPINIIQLKFRYSSISSFQGLEGWETMSVRLYITVNPNLSHNTDILNFLKFTSSIVLPGRAILEELNFNIILFSN